MAYEMLVGLTLSDEKVYQDYRTAMMPLLRQFGGSFRYDFKVAQVLKSESDLFINRVFVISFEDQASKEEFFADPDYKAVRERFFDKSVKTTTIISEYERD